MHQLCWDWRTTWDLTATCHSCQLGSQWDLRTPIWQTRLLRPEEMWLAQDLPREPVVMAIKTQVFCLPGPCLPPSHMFSLRKIWASKKKLSSKKKGIAPILLPWFEFPWYSCLCTISEWWSRAALFWRMLHLLIPSQLHTGTSWTGSLRRAGRGRLPFSLGKKMPLG